MNTHAPFERSDLEDLNRLLERAEAVVAMEDIADGRCSTLDAIGLRHDVDNVIEPAIQMAEWEAERGYRSTYFILHTAPYWQQKGTLHAALQAIRDCGHEIGFHINAITEAIRTGRDPVAIAAEVVGELREMAGAHVHGVVAHGDAACYEHGFINDELFLDSARPDYGDPRRMIAGRFQLAPVYRSGLGLDYDPNWLPRDEYLSDSGGEWSKPFDEVAARFPTGGQLHMLVHPCWWTEAFTPVGAPV